MSDTLHGKLNVPVAPFESKVEAIIMPIPYPLRGEHDSTRKSNFTHSTTSSDDRDDTRQIKHVLRAQMVEYTSRHVAQYPMQRLCNLC